MLQIFGSEPVTIGVANISEKFDKTTLEVGGGYQVPVTGTTYVYTDARYDRSRNLSVDS